jgi:integrase
MNLDDSLLSETEQVAKYCLLVQMLTGMGYSDMKALEHSNIILDQNENQYLIEKERNKTGVRFKVFLTDNAKHMVENLKRLTENSERPFNIPTIDYSLRMYKVIGKKAGIAVNITTYTLRHTFAVNFMENDGRIEDLAKILGHTLLKATQIYGKISNKRLAEKTKQLQTTSKIHQLQEPIMKAV